MIKMGLSIFPVNFGRLNAGKYNIMTTLLCAAEYRYNIIIMLRPDKFRIRRKRTTTTITYRSPDVCANSCETK